METYRCSSNLVQFSIQLPHIEVNQLILDILCCKPSFVNRSTRDMKPIRLLVYCSKTPPNKFYSKSYTFRPCPKSSHISIAVALTWRAMTGRLRWVIVRTATLFLRPGLLATLVSIVRLRRVRGRHECRRFRSNHVVSGWLDRRIFPGLRFADEKETDV